MGTQSVPTSSSRASRCRFSGDGTAPTLWRSDPSPAAEGLEAVRVALVHERGDVGLARKDLADAQVFQVFLVFGQSRSDNPRAGVGCELDGEAADASVRPHD